MVGLKLYVEGGGDSSALKTACREGFRSFITKAGIDSRPRIVACGSRRDAFESFCTAVNSGQAAMLLVDSEEPVASGNAQGAAKDWRPWQHLKQRPGDNWDKPDRGDECDCHLMVPCMESWIIADPETLERFFGAGFDKNKLPKSGKIEAVQKQDIYDSLKQSSRGSRTKGEYDKGRHSFNLLACIDPTKVSAASPWARRFVDLLKSRMDP